MAGPRIALQPAYVLHRRPYRDTSLIVEAFTPEYGRVGLVARGARRGRSPLAGLLQPFQPLLVSWAGRGELHTLTGAEAKGAASPFPGEHLMSGFYLNELLMRLVPRQDPNPALFDVYGSALERLRSGEGGEWGLRIFEKELLEQLGYGLLLSGEAAAGIPIQAERRYCYHLENGPSAEGGDGIPVRGHTLLALAGRFEPDTAALGEAKRLMRAALGLYLGDRPLRTRALARSMRTNKDRSGER